MRFFISLLFLSTIFLYGCSSKVTQKPNIIYILADDLNFKDLSCYGQKAYVTPNIDALAESGVIFSQAYANAEGVPTRGSLLTGLHVGHSSIRSNMSSRGQEFLPSDSYTVADMLNGAGYSTGFVGQWGLGLQGSEGVPEKQGFDFTYGIYDNLCSHSYFPDHVLDNGNRITLSENVKFDHTRLQKMNNSAEPSFLNEYDENGFLISNNALVYSPQMMDEAAFKFLDENVGSPFFLYYASQLPHGPVIIDDLGEMNDNETLPQRQREWAAMVLRLDHFVGELVDYLKETDQYDNTIIFFSSDNGYSMSGYMGKGFNHMNWPDDPYLNNKGPFNGGKYSLQEGGLRVPLIVSYPAMFDPKKVNTPVWLIDFFATAADIANCKSSPKTDGHSLLSLLNDEDASEFENRPMYFSYQREQALRIGRWKAHRDYMKAPIHLYDVEQDTYCLNDLSFEYPDVVALVDSIMNTVHEPHMWYRDPWENQSDYLIKREAAIISGTIQN